MIILFNHWFLQEKNCIQWWKKATRTFFESRYWLDFWKFYINANSPTFRILWFKSCPSPLRTTLDDLKHKEGGGKKRHHLKARRTHASTTSPNVRPHFFELQPGKLTASPQTTRASAHKPTSAALQSWQGQKKKKKKYIAYKCVDVHTHTSTSYARLSAQSRIKGWKRLWCRVMRMICNKSKATMERRHFCCSHASGEVWHHFCHSLGCAALRRHIKEEHLKGPGGRGGGGWN